MFSSDRDLLTLEPLLFRDAAWTAQRLVKGAASTSGTTLTLDTFDNTLEAAAITAGHVVLFDTVAYEVLERLSPTAATISRPRATPDDPPIPPPSSSGRPLAIHTFAPQIQSVHHQLLLMLGLDPAAPAQPGAPTEASITNPRTLAHVEALGALYLIFAAAGAAGPPDSLTLQRAEWYRKRFDAARQTTAAHLDLNNDGIPDATRRLNIIQLQRA